MYSVTEMDTRECLGGLVERNITGRHLIDELDRLGVDRGYPSALRCDNGPELAFAAMADRAGERTGLHSIPPGQLWRNGYVESFNSGVRDECLNINMLWSLAQARVVISDWKADFKPQPATPRARLPGPSCLRPWPHPSMIDSYRLRHLCHVLQVGGGGCILRAPVGPVDLDPGALREGSRFDQVKRHVRAGVGAQPSALADDHRDDELVDLVDEVVFEQPPGQGAAAVHRRRQAGTNRCPSASPSVLACNATVDSFICPTRSSIRTVRPRLRQPASAVDSGGGTS